MKNVNDIQELEKILSLYDKEYYYHILLLPKTIHRILILLRSFNLELACIFSKAHNVQAGMIRLQWWEDVIKDTKSPWRGELIKHSLQDMIISEINAGNLHKESLLQMIESRRLEFQVDNFNTTDEFYNYVENISSAYFYHVIQGLNIPLDHKTKEIINLAGRSWGITSIMRGMAFFKEQNRSVFSKEQLQACKIASPALIHSNNLSCENKLLMESLTVEVKSYLDDIHNKISSYEIVGSDSVGSDNKKHRRNLKKAVIPLIFVKDYLKEIRSLDFNVYAIDHNKKHFTSLIKVFLTTLGS